MYYFFCYPRKFEEIYIQDCKLHWKQILGIINVNLNYRTRTPIKFKIDHAYKIAYYSFKIFLHFWLAKIPHINNIIHHK